MRSSLKEAFVSAGYEFDYSSNTFAALWSVGLALTMIVLSLSLIGVKPLGHQMLLARGIMNLEPDRMPCEQKTKEPKKYVVTVSASCIGKVSVFLYC